MHGGYRRRVRRWSLMPVNQQQAQMLAALAAACRPHRAPTWDEAGIVANIAKVRDRDLATVALAVIRAASDRDAKSPGVIPTRGPHWSERLAEDKWEPTIVPREERCSVCSLDQVSCESRTRGEHEFVSAATTAAAKRGAEVHDIAAALKAEVQPMREPATRDKPSGDGSSRVAAIREQLETNQETA